MSKCVQNVQVVLNDRQNHQFPYTLPIFLALPAALTYLYTGCILGVHVCVAKDFSMIFPLCACKENSQREGILFDLC